MAKPKKSEEDKTFAVTVVMKVARTDEGEKVLLEIPVSYPNLNRADAVVIQDALVATLRQLVDIGYRSVELGGDPEAAKFCEAMRAVIRGEKK